MKKFFLGLGLDLVAGAGLGVLLCVIGFGIYKQITADQDTKDAEIQDQIAAKVEPWEGTYLSELQIAELAKIYLADKQNFGLVIGISSNGQTRICGYGRISNKLTQPPDGDSVFEIGSITKTFTGLALATMANRNEIKLEDTLASLLPAQVKIPGDARRLITLEHLMTHSSGLPRVPSNLGDNSPDNPYKDYTTNDLYEALKSASRQKEAHRTAL